MKLNLHLLLLAAGWCLSQSVAKEESKLLLRVYVTSDDDCTVTRESQCDGQNWAGSTCCANPGYECRWDDHDQSVMRCQKTEQSGGQVDQSDMDTSEPSTTHLQNDGDEEESMSEDNNGGEQESPDSLAVTVHSSASSISVQPGTSTDSSTKVVDVWAECSKGESCKGGGVCVRHSIHYAQCKPLTLPSGAMCGQDTGVNVWHYDHCPVGEACYQLSVHGFRCKKHYHHRRHHKKHA